MGIGWKTFSFLKKEDERVHRRKAGHCYSLLKQISPLQVNSSQFAKQPKATPVKNGCCQTNKGECRILSPSLPVKLSWTNLANSAQGSRSHVSGFLSSITADGNSVHFHTASHSPSNHTQPDSKESNYYATCTPLGKQCSTTYPLNPNWSDLKGEEDLNGDKQKVKELELKNNNITECQRSQYQSISTTNTDKTVLVPKLTDFLVPSMKEEQEEEQKKNRKKMTQKTILKTIPRQITIQMTH